MNQTLGTLLTVSVVGTTVISTIVSSIVSHSYSTICYMNSAASHTFSDIDDIIQKNDVINKLQLCQNLIDELRLSKHSSTVIIESIKTIDNIISEIQLDIKWLHEQRQFQNTLYFGSWRFRRPDLSKLLQDLQLRISILNLRFNDLVKIASVLN